MFLAVIIMFHFFKSINWIQVYLVYAAIYIFGVEAGYHRYLSHHVSYHNYFGKFCLVLGSLTHIGGFKESIMYHLHHHQHADTQRDHQKTFFTALYPKPGDIKFVRSLYYKPIKKIQNDYFLNLIDENYYIWLFFAYSLFWIILGTELFLIYFLLPICLVLLAHRYGAYLFHSIGYQNYEMNNKSGNSIILLPFFFGENWHNNHHQFPSSLTTKKKWWEIDPCYLLTFIFIKNHA